jgi:hypothetical protein
MIVLHTWKKVVSLCIASAGTMYTTCTESAHMHVLATATEATLAKLLRILPIQPQRKRRPYLHSELHCQHQLPQ